MMHHDSVDTDIDDESPLILRQTTRVSELENHWRRECRKWATLDTPAMVHLARIGGHVAYEIAHDELLSRLTRRNKIRDIDRIVVDGIARRLGGNVGTPSLSLMNYVLGYHYGRTLRFGLALKHFDLAQNDLGSDPDFLLDWGRCQYNSGYIDRALECFNQAANRRSAISQDPLQVFRWQAKCLMLKGDETGALGVLETLQRLASSIQTADKESHYGAKSRQFAVDYLPLLYSEAKRYSDALAILNNAVPSSEALARRHTSIRVDALQRLGRFDEALREARLAEDDKRDPALVAEVLRRTGRAFSAASKSTNIEKAIHSGDRTSMMLLQADNVSLTYSMPPASTMLLSSAIREFDAGNSDLGEHLLWELAGDSAESLGPGLCIHLIGQFQLTFPLISDKGRTDAFVSEVTVAYPNDPNVQFSSGRYWHSRSDATRAASALERAVRLYSDRPIMAAWPSALLAELNSDAGHGDISTEFDEIIEHSEKAQPWYFYNVVSIALRTALKRKEHWLGLRWAKRALLIAPWTLWWDGDGKEVLRVAAQIALASGEYQLAGEYLGAYRAAVAVRVKFSLPLHIYEIRHELSEATFLHAIAAIFAREQAQATALKNAAKAFATKTPMETIFGIAELVANGRVIDAAEALLIQESDGWIGNYLGDLLLNRLAIEGADQGLQTRLKIWLGGIPRNMPSAEILYSSWLSANGKVSQLREQRDGLQANIDSVRRALTVLTTAMRWPTEVEVPLRVFQHEVVDGIDIASAVERFVDHLIPIATSWMESGERYSNRVPTNLWQLLSHKVRGRLELASKCFGICQRTGDYGPVVVVLTSAVEALLRSIVVAPLTVVLEAKSREGATKMPMSLRAMARATLGQLPACLGLKLSSPEYTIIVDTWIEQSFSGDFASFLRGPFSEFADDLAGVRNPWAHGGDPVSMPDLEVVENLLFDSNMGFFKIVSASVVKSAG